jgi:hypothetical protein
VKYGKNVISRDEEEGKGRKEERHTQQQHNP